MANVIADQALMATDRAAPDLMVVDLMLMERVVTADIMATVTRKMKIEFGR